MQNIQLKDLLSDCFTGLIKSAYTSVDVADNAEQESVNLIKIKHITDTGIALQGLEKVIISDKYKKGKSKDFSLRSGDILLAARGEKIKMVLMTEKELVNHTTFDTNVILLRANQELIKPEVLLNYMLSPLGLNALKTIQKGGTAIKSINPRDIVTLTIPVPLLDEQEKMVKEHWAAKDLYLSTLVMAEKQKQMTNSQIWSRFQG